MSKANTWEAGLLNLLFNNTAFTLVGDAGGLLPSATAGSLYVSLHTADPGEAGDQSTSETTYGAYARVAVARTAGGWTITGSSVSPTSHIEFPQCTSGTATVTHVGIGTSASGAGKLLYSGALSPSINISTGIIPRVTNTSTITED